MPRFKDLRSKVWVILPDGEIKQVTVLEKEQLLDRFGEIHVFAPGVRPVMISKRNLEQVSGTSPAQVDEALAMFKSTGILFEIESANPTKDREVPSLFVFDANRAKKLGCPVPFWLMG